MRVLDTSFLIDYGNGVETAAEYLLDHSEERFVVPAPIYTEYLLGTVHSSAPTDIDSARAELSWVDVVKTDESTSVRAAEIADEIGPEGPDLTAIDALVVAVADELDAPLVSSDSDCTHPEIQQIVDTGEYRNDS
ncbi:MAG: putative nucleic acid-binding protein, contains PIN domain protein [Halonotius sp. J07HN6]|jgi:PIN domain.|nr:MAG: putative nucleic acid-binding protein, contains PIN domain protein [Halonotius sp. J07HN6]ERH05717.1 MAG: putative nucleic acid-binding protein, contains PIN domain protein [Halonotius sp. J07HN4]